MKKIVVFFVAVLIAALTAIPVLAYSRTADAVVYADFDGDDTELSSGAISANTLTYLNGIGEETKAHLSGGALKIELNRDGFVVLGSDNVKIRDDSGNLNYKYMVIRIKGEKGNENRTEGGGLLLFIGGGDGSHAITLNDRPTGAAPSALDANGNPMNAISTEWQEFAIALTDTNVRDKAGCNGININSVSTTATLYIDDIYFSNTAPSTAAVYNSETSTDAITDAGASETESDTGNQPSADNASSDNATADTGSSVADGSTEETVNDGELIGNTNIERLDPPSREAESTSPAGENSLGVVALVISIVAVVLLAAVLVLIYIKVVLKIN